jgi:hypothetical protein
MLAGKERPKVAHLSSVGSTGDQEAPADGAYSGRARSPDPRPPVTKEQIADAIARAVALRRWGNRHPERIAGQAMDPSDAQRMTDQWRLRTRGPVHFESSPWMRIGWVCISVGWDVSLGIDCRRYHAVWSVWLHVEDGRVWQRLDRPFGWDREPGDPYP